MPSSPRSGDEGIRIGLASSPQSGDDGVPRRAWNERRGAPRNVNNIRMTSPLRALLAEVVPSNPFYAHKFAGLDLDNFAQLPFTTKAELVADQQAHAPYGSALTYPRERYTRLHQTSGTSSGRPLRWLDT